MLLIGTETKAGQETEPRFIASVKDWHIKTTSKHILKSVNTKKKTLEDLKNYTPLYKKEEDHVTALSSRLSY
jgi:hypothetical protein